MTTISPKRDAKRISRHDPHDWLYQAALGTLPYREKKIMHNTYISNDAVIVRPPLESWRWSPELPGDLHAQRYGIRLYATVVVEHFVVPDIGMHYVRFDHGGYTTVTTKDRMNRFGHPNLYVYQRDWTWYVHDRLTDTDHLFNPLNHYGFPIDGSTHGT